ncbi:MAG: hypothetical protein ACR2GC_10135 [Methyloceanibacter sp.]|uniref:hypothetical protein n=1 Tax=Methyloceanibacter sp. TaxID=1965321 RepID=UPI003D9B7DED
MVTDVTIDRDDLEAALSKLKAQEHEAEIQELEEVERTKLERQAAEAERLKREAEMQTELGALMRENLTDVGEIQDALRIAKAGIDRWTVRTARMAKLSHAISGKKVPLPLEALYADRWMGECVAAIMMGAGDPSQPVKRQLGQIVWPIAPFQSSRDMVEALRAFYRQHVNALIGKDS